MKLAQLLDAISTYEASEPVTAALTAGTEVPEMPVPEGLTAAACEEIVTEAVTAWETSKTSGTPDLAIVAAAKKANKFAQMLKDKAAKTAAAEADMAALTKTASTDGAATTDATATGDAPKIDAKTAAATANLHDTTDTPPATAGPRVASFKAAGSDPRVAAAGDALEPATFGRLLGETASRMSTESAPVVVASITYIDPQAPRLGGDSPSSNTVLLAEGTAELRAHQARLQAVGGETARVAAANAGAGFCGKPQYIETLPNSGTAERPLTGGGALRSFPIDGTIIKHYRRSGLASVAGSVAVWTDTLQKLVDRDSAATWKPVIDLTCNGTETTVTPYMIWAGAVFDTFQEMARPDRVSEMQTNVLRAASRLAEVTAWDTIIGLGGIVGTTGAPAWSQMADIAGVREIIVSIMAHYGYDNRDPQDGWRAIFPYGFDKAIAVALGFRADAQDTPAAGRAAIDEALRGLGFGAGVYMLDDHTGTPARPTLPAPGATAAATTVPILSSRVWSVTIYDPASVFHGKKGVFGASVQRGPDNDRRNQALFRLEDMEAIGRDGENAPITVKFKVNLTGSRAQRTTYDVTDVSLAAALL